MELILNVNLIDLFLSLQNPVERHRLALIILFNLPQFLKDSLLKTRVIDEVLNQIFVLQVFLLYRLCVVMVHEGELVLRKSHLLLDVVHRFELPCLVFEVVERPLLLC